MMMNQEKAAPYGMAEPRATDKLDEAKKRASDIAERAKDKGREKLETGKEAAANQTEKLADAVQRAAQELKGGEQQSLADYAGQLAGTMRTFAENLRGKSVDELLTDTQQLARKNPGLFFFGSVALGVAVSRFLKASTGPTPVQDSDSKYDSSAAPAVEPVTFERGAELLSEAPPPQSAAPLDPPSFADRSKGGK
jgi:hypothetical protein